MNFQKFLEDAGYECRSYSGRGMYGRKCVAIENEDRPNHFFSNVVRTIADLELDPGEVYELAKILDDMTWDSLGMGIVIYFPSIPFEGEEKAASKED